MKIPEIILFASFLVVGCTNRPTSSVVTNVEQDKDTFNVHLSAVDTTVLDREYDEDEHCYKVTYKSDKWKPGHRITANYFANTDGSASGFMITADVLCDDIKESKMLVKTKTSSYEFLPTLMQSYGDGTSFAVFSFQDANMIAAMKDIALSGTYADAYVYYNGNKLRIPLKEVQQIRNIARCYVNDGGRFE